MKLASEIVKLATSYIGLNEKDESYKKIIDIYNSYKGAFPRGLKMSYDWPWCACFWSSLAIQLSYTDIIPIEISCNELIKLAKKMGIWVEADSHTPKIGDGVLYDWDDSGKGDNTGFPDHVGIIDYVNKKSGYFTVIEGNYSDSVKRRTVSINGKYIRGFITPKYDEEITVNKNDYTENNKKSLKEIAYEVIIGKWGNDPDRSKNLRNAGYDPDEIQKSVNQILNIPSINTEKKSIVSTCIARFKDTKYSGSHRTTTDLYCRNDAGTNKKALCLIPKGTKVFNYGYYNVFDGQVWLYITFTLNGISYVGFSSKKYLVRA